MGKILALDFGLKRTGLAISDEGKSFAFGLTTVESRELISYIRQLVQKEKIELIVLGEPKRLNTEDAHITQNVYLLREELARLFPEIKTALHDERFTSKMAFQSMLDGGLSKKQRQNKALVDEISATIILQSYLSSVS